MNRKEYKQFIKKQGRARYRGRLFYTQQDSPAGLYNSWYLYRADDPNLWFVATEQEILSREFEFVPNEEQIELTEIVKTVVKSHKGFLAKDGKVTKKKGIE